jgi:hypothetical protein
MARQRFRSRVASDFVEADLDTVYALLCYAEMEAMSGACQAASRALKEAEMACRDGQLRLCGLEDAESRRFRPRLERMRGLIERMKSRIRVA